MAFYTNWFKGKPGPITLKGTPAKDDNGVKLPVKGGRQSEPDTISLFAAMQNELAQIEPDFDIECIRYLEYLAKFNSEISYAVDNIVQLGNTEYTIHFGDDVPEELAKEMTTAARLGEKNIYSGGLNSLINDLLAQAAVTGAISAEAIPNLNLADIDQVVLVNTASVRFMYDKELSRYKPYQKLKRTLGGTLVGNLRELNTTTYKYYALRRFGEKPYAIPPMMAALESVMIERDMIESLKSIVKKLGVFGFMSLLVKAPQRQPNETDTVFANRCLEYLEQIRPEAEKGFNSGLSLGFKDTHEFKMENTSMNVQGARELFNLVSEFKMAGVKQDPLMLGRNFNVAETMARVILSKLTTQIKNYQLLIASFLEDLFALRLGLLGYDEIQNIRVEFTPAMVSDKAKDEDAVSKRIANAKDLYNQGIINQQQVAQHLGYEEADQEEPRQQVLAPGETAEAGSGAGSKGDPTATASPDKKKAKAKAKNSLDSLEAVEYEFDLGKGAPEFSYITCSHGRKEVDLEHFAKDPDVNKFFSSYYNATKGIYDKAAKGISAKIAKALGTLGDGASLQQVQDKVLATLYKQWPGEFSGKQKLVIDKWVKNIYTDFRKDKSPFGNSTKKIPDATFGLKDYRTLNYFKNSDALYLGKFITDKDTKKKITDFIKDQYLEKGLPIGSKSEVINNFRDEFEGVLDGEAWKISKVLSTTVNKLRNYAALSYMEEAGVEQFEVRGINDRLQCSYCASMQGRKFSLGKAIGKMNTLTSSSPEYVSSTSPFITAIFKGKDGLDELNSLDDAAIQDKGVDTPPYHCSCRDRIIAVID